MASPEFKEGQKPLVEKKTEFAEVPENLRDTITSVDAQRTPLPAVEHEGEHLVKPVPSEVEHIDFSKKEIEEMMKGSISESSTWLGAILDRFAKIVRDVGKKVIYSKRTA